MSWTQPCTCTMFVQKDIFDEVDEEALCTFQSDRPATKQLTRHSQSHSEFKQRESGVCVQSLLCGPARCQPRAGRGWQKRQNSGHPGVMSCVGTNRCTYRRPNSPKSLKWPTEVLLSELADCFGPRIVGSLRVDQAQENREFPKCWNSKPTF